MTVGRLRLRGARLLGILAASILMATVLIVLMEWAGFSVVARAE